MLTIREYWADLRAVYHPVDWIAVTLITAATVGNAILLWWVPSGPLLLLTLALLIFGVIMVEALRILNHPLPLYSPDEWEEREACKRRHPAYRGRADQ